MGHSSVYSRYKKPGIMNESYQKLLRVDQVAKQLSCHTSFIYKLIETGKLKCMKLGTRKGIRISIEAVEVYKQQQIDKVDFLEE